MPVSVVAVEVSGVIDDLSQVEVSTSHLETGSINGQSVSGITIKENTGYKYPNLHE